MPSQSHDSAPELQLDAATADLRSCGFLHTLKYGLVDAILLQTVITETQSGFLQPLL